MPFYKRDLNIHGFWHLRGVLEPIPLDTRDGCSYFIHKAKVFMFIAFLYLYSFSILSHDIEPHLLVNYQPSILMDMLWHFTVRVVFAVVL